MTTTLMIHHNPEKLPPASASVIPVQLYDSSSFKQRGISYIGKSVPDPIRRLGVELSPASIDFLTIALAITAADTFILREDAADSWAREIRIEIPLWQPEPWIGVQNQLERALQFLSGDIWSIQFLDGGFQTPVPYARSSRYRLIDLFNLDSVCLFSGGIDSGIGVLDLLAQDRHPLLVSHSYGKDATRQEIIASQFSGRFSRLAMTAHPRFAERKTEISMRTRSLNFLAFAVAGCEAIMRTNHRKSIELIVPENGFISLNAPLTPRRIGSLSTRTTHPYFLAAIQEIFASVGISVKIVNPYQFETKGEMILNCHNQADLQKILESTVSCSHWKRKNQQCGYCVPCLIRRAAIHNSNLSDPTNYRVQHLQTLGDQTKDDLFALAIAIFRSKNEKIDSWISKSGPLPAEGLEDFEGLFLRGLYEVERFLMDEGFIQ